MEKFFAYQNDKREPCKYGRKCFQKNKEHTEKYKHPPTKEDIKENINKKTKKRDSKGRIKRNNATNGESSNVNNIIEENLVSQANDMEVPEYSNINVESEATNSSSINNQQNSTEYVVPSTRQLSQQQQQLLLTNTALEDCSGDDGIVPCTPTLFTPRRLDGETVSSPHVPSSSVAQQFTFVGESQTSQTQDSNDSEPVCPSRQPTKIKVPNTNVCNQRIKQLFLVGDMPKDFYDLWAFCKKECPTHPEDALLEAGLKLVGPYDILAGHMDNYVDKDSHTTVLHWRYYYDPPEFQTIIASTSSQFHIGYYRDDPLSMPINIVANDPSKDCVIQKLGKSLFQALCKYLTSKNDCVASRVYEAKLHNFEKRIGHSAIDGRYLNPIAKTFHKAGIVVPYDTKTDVGYRPLSVTEKTLRLILKCYREASDIKKVEIMDKLQPIINYANIACDECDFGTQLELGIDIFCDGNPELHRICGQLLVPVYNLLRRDNFAVIIKAHLENRRMGPNMSIL